MSEKKNSEQWISLGNSDELKNELINSGGLKEYVLGEKKIVLVLQNGEFSALNNKCNHMGGPLSRGKIKNGCVECPWHYWQFNAKTGEAQSESSTPIASHGGVVPNFPLKTEGGELKINLGGESERVAAKYNKQFPGFNLMREPERAPGKVRVLGISTTAMDREHPRFSTSMELLKTSLARAERELDVETRFISLADLNFRNCEGFYSKSERACAWPCSITKMDEQDEMVQIYENLVFWADVVIVATPIRWGNASSLYYKMAERLNSVQNQITVKNRVLIKNKVAGFLIIGGQDNIQSVAGQMLNFFGELGFVAPPFPYVGHSLGWSSENMEHNMDYVKGSEHLHQQSFDLVERATKLAQKLIGV